METPLQPSLLAPCSGQAVQFPVYLQQGRVQCWVGVEARGRGGGCGAWLTRLQTPPGVDFHGLSAALQWLLVQLPWQ